MGGPWRARGFDATAWRPPAPRVEVVAEALSASPRDYVTGIVIGYVAAVVTSVALLLTLLKHGW